MWKGDIIQGRWVNSELGRVELTCSRKQPSSSRVFIKAQLKVTLDLRHSTLSWLLLQPKPEKQSLTVAPFLFMAGKSFMMGLLLYCFDLALTPPEDDVT
ncbi:uncharacterized [Tachysurus ichikawai]